MALLCGELTGRLARFGWYTNRYAAAMARVERGRRSWVDGVDADSCHAAWRELHEDLTVRYLDDGLQIWRVSVTRRPAE